MNDKERLLSEEQLDFLAEMMNIGAGNAATALTQMLRCPVNLLIPEVHVLPVPEVPPILGDPSLPVVCVRMGMVGDVSGDLFFIVEEKCMKDLIRVAEKATPGTSQSWSAGPKNRELNDLKLSVIEEIGNIVGGVYLTAVHDFCKLNIYHTVPTVAIDMIQALLDQKLVALSRQVQTIILIENEFIVEENHIRTFLMVVPSTESVNKLVNSIGQAKIASREG